MAFNAGTGWEVRTSAASADGGGGFSGGGSNLAAPSAPTTGTATTGGTVAANTYYAVICYLDANGNPGPKSAQTSQVTTGATSTLTVTSPAASAGAVSYAVWWTVTNGGPYWPSPGTAVAIGTNSTRTTTPATSGTQPPGTDYSQQDAAQIAYTDAVVQATTTTAVSVLNPFTPAMVGNVFNVTSGGTVQRAQITAVSASAVATFDKSLGTAAQVCVGNLGGALLTLSAAALLVVAGNGVYAQDGTYPETLTLSVAGGNGTPIAWIGYDVTRGDTPTGTGRPLIDAQSGTRATCLAFSTFAGNVFRNFRMTGASGSNITTGTNGSVTMEGCSSTSAAADGFNMTVGSTTIVNLLNCEFGSNGSDGIDISSTGPLTVNITNCYLHDNVASGLVSAMAAANITMFGSVVEANGATGVIGSFNTFINNTVYGNAGAAVDGYATQNANGSRPAFMYGNLFDTNGRYGANRVATTNAPIVADYNNYNGNGTAPRNNLTAGAHDTASVPGFTNAAGGDFSIDTTLKAAWTFTIMGSASISYVDPGAVQRQEAGAAGGMLRHPGMVGGTNA